MSLQSGKSPNFENFGTLDLGVLGKMANHREYYKGEGGGFPQVQAMVSLCIELFIFLHVECPLVTYSLQFPIFGPHLHDL
jgi:hypothetical protein